MKNFDLAKQTNNEIYSHDKTWCIEKQNNCLEGTHWLEII